MNIGKMKHMHGKHKIIRNYVDLLLNLNNEPLYFREVLNAVTVEFSTSVRLY